MGVRRVRTDISGARSVVEVTLLRACARYPNMRVFNWAAYARTKWYISDGVHFTSAGYAVRGRMIAQALARAFPKTGHSTGCLVS